MHRIIRVCISLMIAALLAQVLMAPVEVYPKVPQPRRNSASAVLFPLPSF